MRESVIPLPVAVFTDLLHRHQWPLYGFVRHLLLDDEQARDVVQETFCKAWKAFQRAGPPFAEGHDAEQQRRWLFHVAYCEAISVLRRRKRLRWESLEDTAHEDASLTEAFENQIAENDALRAALTALSREDSAAVLLNVVYGFAAPEIASMLDISLQAAKKRLTRAKQRLRAAYFAQEEDHERRATPQ